MVDPLSGIANRRAFLAGAIRLLSQQGIDHEPLAMLLFDLDRFKDVNDRMGHAVGDRVLQTFAATTTATLGSGGLFGRIGGGRGASLLPVGDLGEGYAIADRVRRNFARSAARFADGDLVPTVSAGIALAVAGKCSLDTLLDVADRALYRAKANGRNRVETNACPREVVAGAPPIAAGRVAAAYAVRRR